MSWPKRIGLGLLAVLLLVVAGFLIWAYTPLGPMPEASAALQSDQQVTVENSPWIIFRPANRQLDTGLIFYPGGRVDPRSYAPAARAIAAQGYLVVVVPMPLNLAVLGVNRAEQVRAAYPQIRHWVVGGHSLGGAMAAQYVYGHPQAAQGLALWASYPASGSSLADRHDLHVLSIFGTEDGAARRGSFATSHSLLPSATHWVEIQGGNHAQFGWYGPQPGDNPATISRTGQQAQAVKTTVELLADVSP